MMLYIRKTENLKEKLKKYGLVPKYDYDTGEICKYIEHNMSGEFLIFINSGKTFYLSQDKEDLLDANLLYDLIKADLVEKD